MPKNEFIALRTYFKSKIFIFCPSHSHSPTLSIVIERRYTSSHHNWIASSAVPLLGKQRHDPGHPGSVPRRRDNMLQGRPKGCLAGHSAGKGCLSGICRGRKTQNQYSSRLCRESTCFHGIAVPPYWFHSYIFEIVTIVVYWFCGRGKRPVPTVESWRCSLMPQCFGRPFSWQPACA